MEVALIKIDGKPFEKLIEVVSNGIGTLYRPRAIRQEADAKAYEIKVIEKAKNEAIAEGKLIEAENLSRINDRLVAKEVKRQNNIDDVVEIAANDLKETEQVSDMPVDQDWSARFFDIVQDVSDEKMKILWGKILAGEIRTPKSYSMRTMELLRNLSKEEADIFVKVSQFVLRQDEYFIYDNTDEMRKFGIRYQDIAKLTEIGLIQAGTFVHKTYKAFPDRDNRIGFKYANYVIIITIKSNAKEVSLPINCLTTAGQELYKLIDVSPNTEFINMLGKQIKKDNVIVEYTNILSITPDGRIEYQEPTIKI